MTYNYKRVIITTVNKGGNKKMVFAVMCCIGIYGLAELLGEIEED